MPPRRKWGWARRPTTNYTRALSAALSAQRAEDVQRKLDTRDAENDARMAFLESAIGPLAGSHDLEDAFCGTSRKVGIVPILGGIAFHDVDSRLNAAGLPDAIAIVGKTLYLIEFKRQPDYPSPAQRLWLHALEGVTSVVSGVVKPDGWSAFVEFVKRQREADKAATDE